MPKTGASAIAPIGTTETLMARLVPACETGRRDDEGLGRS